ncbi:MAG: prenyltransferase, partial [Candidatus Kapaibacterium sp.]
VPTVATTLDIVIGVLGVVFLHLAANVFNDYFDAKSGTDEANTSYFLKYSGGSRAIELRLITVEGTFRLATILSLIALGMGVYLSSRIGTGIYLFGALGLLSGFFYTAPPLRLVARHGLGELFIGLTFGPLITAGMVYVVTAQMPEMGFLLGIPAGLLTSNILLINQVPDADSDATTGKNHLVVTFGKNATPGIYLATSTAAALMTFVLAYMLDNPFLYAPGALALVGGFRIYQHMRMHLSERSLVSSNVNTIALQAVFSILFIVALLVK